MRPSSFCDLVSPAKIYVHNRLLKLVGHVQHGFIAKNSSVINDYIDTAICINAGFDNTITIFNR